MQLSERVPSATATPEVEMASVGASGPDVDGTRAGYVDGIALAGPPSEVGALVSQRPQREGRASRVRAALTRKGQCCLTRAALVPAE
jgi:hypothetical protein